MAHIKVSVKGGHQLKAAAHGLASAATLGYAAWHGGDAPASAAGLAIIAGYSSFTAFRLGAQLTSSRHGRGNRRA